MTTPNAGVLDTVLNTFRTQIDSGFGALRGPVNGTLGGLIVVSVAVMALFWALDEGAVIWGPLVRKAMVVGWWSYMILNWQTLALAVYTAFGALGAATGGAGGLAGFLNYPSQVVHLGIVNAQVLLDLAAYYAGQTNQWGTPPIANTGLDIMAAFKVVLGSICNLIEALVCALLVFIAYFWLALEIVVTTIEFHIVILLGFCILPFGVFERTAGYAERVLGYVVSAGFKVMALGIVIGLGQSFLTNYQLAYTPGVLPGLDQMAGLALGILVVLLLALSAPKYAQAIISGGAATGVGSLAGAAGLAIGTGLAVAGAGRAAAQVVSGAGRGGSDPGGGGSRPAAAAGPSGAPPGGGSGGGSPETKPSPSSDAGDLAATLVTPASTRRRPSAVGGITGLTATAQRVAADADGEVAAPPPLRNPSDDGRPS